MAAMLRDSTIAIAILRTRPWAIPLAMITMRNQFMGFLWFPYMDAHDTGQRIPCFDRCQLIITWMSNIKEVHSKPRLHVSVNLLFGVWPPCCPLRPTADFPKSANKDTLPVYNILFESHWSAHLRTDISSYEGGRDFERNCFNPLMPNSDLLILLCLTPVDFTLSNTSRFYSV